jgi:hydrogenase nickel incorporation protein HypB
MCTTCGCGGGEARIEGQPAYRHAHEHEAHGHWHADGSWHSHPHDHAQGPSHEHAHDRPHAGALGAVHAPGTTEARVLQVEQDILAKNDAIAAANRRAFAERGVLALNLVSSPGSGKTSLLCRTIESLRGQLPVAVIEGDQQTSFDADRIRATGAPAVQVNTGKGCHLDALMVSRALGSLPLEEGALLFVENVGNLVCPAAFDLGEAHKVVILSVTEGEDKPLKYPDMFGAADLLLVNKVDLLPYVSFDVARAIEYARRVRPGLEAIEVSATTGAGFEAWLAWLARGVAAARAARGDEISRLERRVAELEARLASLGRSAP